MLTWLKVQEGAQAGLALSNSRMLNHLKTQHRELLMVNEVSTVGASVFLMQESSESRR